MAIFTQVAIALGFNGLDIVTGLCAALRKKDLKSYRLRDGLFKKMGFVFCYLLAWVLDNYGDIIGFQIGINVLPIIVLYAITTEIISIVENIHEINPDIMPEKIIEMLHIKEEMR